MVKSCQYLASQSWASFLALFLPLPCLQRKSSEIRKADPRSSLMPAAIATSFSEDDDDDDERLVVAESDADAKVAIDTVAVFVAVIVAVTVSVMLGDVEPDVRLYITNPASTENGAALPLVGI